MATPTITRAVNSSSANPQNAYWDTSDPQISNTNARIHLLEVTGTTYTYAEFFEALAAYSSSGDSFNFTVNTITVNNDTFRPSRIFQVELTESNSMAIIMFKTGTLIHEIPGSTTIEWPDACWCAPMSAPVTNITTGTSIDTASITYGDSTWTATHEITLGYVNWQMTGQLFFYAGNVQPVDHGEPTKDSTPSPFAASLAVICPAPNQTLRVTDNRLTIRMGFEHYNDGTPNKRIDADITGSGTIDASFTIERFRGAGAVDSFCHFVHTNPNSNITANINSEIRGEVLSFFTNDGNKYFLGDLVTDEGHIWRCTSTASAGTTQNPSDTATDWEQVSPDSYSLTDKHFYGRESRQVSGALEAFSTLPKDVNHAYIGQSVRGMTPLKVISRNVGGTGNQYQAALVGANRFNTAAARQGLVFQGLPTARFVYFQQFGRTDTAWLDPPFAFDGTNVQFTRNNAHNTDDFSIYYMRSIGINNRDASGNTKASRGYVVGNQKSSGNYTFQDEETNQWMPGVFPNIRTHANGGTWSVRPVDTTGNGLDGAVGRGVHYLMDAAMERDTTGASNNDFTYYTDSSTSGNAGDNVSYLISKGGIHRIQQNQSLRSTAWSFTSLGSSAITYNNDIDDVPGITDNLINMFKNGLIGVSTTNTTFSANATGQTVTLDGMSNLTQDECDNLVGATIIATAGTGTITAATRTNATTAAITFTVGSQALDFDDNTNVTMLWRSYTWDISSSGSNDITITVDASTNITWDYTAVTALVQAKVEKLAEAKQDAMGAENTLWSSSSDATYGGSSLAINVILERMLNNSGSGADKSFFCRNTTTGTTVDFQRINYSVPSGSSLTLNPDAFLTAINYGSSFTVPARVTHNGSFTDSNGTPNFIDVTLPTGVAANDVTFAVSFQRDRPLLTYVVSTALNTGNVSFNGTSTPSSTTWQAVTRPSATGLDTILTSVSSWDWSPSAAGSVQRIIVQGSLSEANIDVVDPFADGTDGAVVVGVRADLSAYGIYRASEGSEQGSGVAMNLELITSSGTPGTGNLVWYFATDSSGAAQTITRAGGNWTTGSIPSITTVGTRNFLNISSQVANDAYLNSDNVWTLAAVGGKIEPVRNTYTGTVATGTTINLVSDSLRPASASATKSGNITTGAYTITSPGSNSEVKTFITENITFPNEQISTINRLALDINGYDSQSESDRTKIDVGDALDSTIVAQYVGAYGTAAISDMIRVTDTNLNSDHWRIRYDGISQVNYLNIDAVTPVKTGTNGYKTQAADSAAEIFFSSPEYSAPEVTGLVDAAVQRIIDAQTTDLGGRLTNVSLGIPT